MTGYRYIAIDQYGRKHRGYLEASSEQALLDCLQLQALLMQAIQYGLL